MTTGEGRQGGVRGGAQGGAAGRGESGAAATAVDAAVAISADSAIFAGAAVAAVAIACQVERGEGWEGGERREGGWESWSVAQVVAVVPVADGAAVDAAITCRAPSLRAAAPRGRGRKQLVREGESS